MCKGLSAGLWIAAGMEELSIAEIDSPGIGEQEASGRIKETDFTVAFFEGSLFTLGLNLLTFPISKKDN